MPRHRPQVALSALEASVFGCSAEARAAAAQALTSGGGIAAAAEAMGRLSDNPALLVAGFSLFKTCLESERAASYAEALRAAGARARKRKGPTAAPCAHMALGGALHTAALCPLDPHHSPLRLLSARPRRRAAALAGLGCSLPLARSAGPHTWGAAAPRHRRRCEFRGGGLRGPAAVGAHARSPARVRPGAHQPGLSSGPLRDPGVRWRWQGGAPRRHVHVTRRRCCAPGQRAAGSALALSCSTSRQAGRGGRSAEFPCLQNGRGSRR